MKTTTTATPKTNGTRSRSRAIESAFGIVSPATAPAPRPRPPAGAFVTIHPLRRSRARITLRLSAITTLIHDEGMIDGPCFVRADGVQYAIPPHEFQLIEEALQQ